MFPMHNAHDIVDLRLLDHFLTVAEAGSITRAASTLNLTQPAVSRQMSQLEKRLGSVLFDRGASSFTLSSAGRALVAAASPLINRAHIVGQDIRRLHEGELREFRVVCPEATVRGVIAPFVAATGEPIIDTRLAIADHVYGMLGQRNVDIAVNPIMPPLTLSSLLIGTVPLQCFFANDHPLAAQESVHAEDLIGHPLLLLAQGSGLRSVIDSALFEIRGAIEIAAQPESSDLARAMAAAGAGVCIDLGRPPFGLARRPLLSAEGKEIAMPIYAAWESDHYGAQAIRALAEHLAAWARTQPDWSCRSPSGISDQSEEGARTPAMPAQPHSAS